MNKLDRTIAKVRSGHPFHLFSLRELSLLEQFFIGEHNPLAKAVRNEILTRI